MRDLGEFIREQRRQAQLSLRKLSEQAGISNPYLSQIERGLRKPSADILQAIAKALRISAETLYLRAGILESDSAGSDVVSAILKDTSITEGQKQILIEIYHSLRIVSSKSPGGAAAAGKGLWALETSVPEDAATNGSETLDDQGNVGVARHEYGERGAAGEEPPEGAGREAAV